MSGQLRLDEWSTRRIHDVMERLCCIGGNEEQILRSYIQFINKGLWRAVAKRLRLKETSVAAAIKGKSDSPHIIAELERTIQLHQSATQPDHAKQILLARPAMYRGLYTRVADQLGLSVSFVARVAKGRKKSQGVQQALTAEVLRIEHTLKPTEVQE